MRSSSPFIAKAVRAITGMSWVAASPLRSPVARSPSIPGSWISIRMRSGCSAPASATPASASVALRTVCPTDSSRNVANVMLAGLSSTTNTFAISDHRFAIGHYPPNLEREAVTVEVSLLHDSRHVTVQLVAILGRDRFGSDDEYRYRRRSGILMERCHDVESVDLGHQQVENDQIRQLTSRHLDGVRAPVG